MLSFLEINGQENEKLRIIWMSAVFQRIVDATGLRCRLLSEKGRYLLMRVVLLGRDWARK